MVPLSKPHGGKHTDASRSPPSRLKSVYSSVSPKCHPYNSGVSSRACLVRVESFVLLASAFRHPLQKIFNREEVAFSRLRVASPSIQDSDGVPCPSFHSSYYLRNGASCECSDRCVQCTLPGEHR